MAGLGEFAGMQKDLGRFTFKKYELDDVKTTEQTNLRAPRKPGPLVARSCVRTCGRFSRLLATYMASQVLAPRSSVARNARSIFIFDLILG